MARKSKTRLTMDHSGDREAPDAAAPKRPTASKVGLTMLDAMRAADGLPPRQLASGHRVPLAEVMGRARAAAAQEVPYEWDSGAARFECATVVAMAAMLEARRATDGLTDCPLADDVRMRELRWRCRSWRAAEGRRRDAADDISGAAEESLADVPLERPAPEVAPWVAAGIADAIAERLRVPRAAALVYYAMRGEDGDRCASECNLTPVAFRHLVSRGRADVQAAYPDPRSLLTALALLDDTAGKAAGNRKRHPEEWRTDTGAMGSEDYPNIDGRGVVTRRRRPGGRRRAIDRTDLALAEVVYNARREDGRLERQRGAHRNAGNGLAARR